MNYKIAALCMLGLFPTIGAAVESSYSVITEQSPWGICPTWHVSPEEYNLPPNVWRNQYVPKLDSCVPCGLAWLRPNALHHSYFLEYPEGNFDFAGPDSFVTYVQRCNVNFNVLYVGWPRPVYENVNDSAGWTRYYTKVVERYDGDGLWDMPGLTKPVKHWEICNEPGHWGTNDWDRNAYNGTIEFFRRYTRICWKAIRHADPEAKVVVPAINDVRWFYTVDSSLTADSPVYWLARILEENGSDYIDIISHHYPFHHGMTWGFNSYEEYLDCLEDTINAYAPGKSLWLTEDGVKTNPFHGYTEEEQAVMYKEWYEEILERKWPSKNNKIFFFKLIDDMRGNWGILRSDFTHKPSFDTIDSFITRNTPFIELQAPIGGEEWPCGGQVYISWNATDRQSNNEDLRIAILYSIDEGREWIAISEDEPNDGIYQWTVIDHPTRKCRIRIRAYDEDGLVGQYISKRFLIKGFTFIQSPNPCIGSCSIQYSLPAPGCVRMCIYDITGRRIRTLENSAKGVGCYTIEWNGCNDFNQKVSAGVYFARLKFGIFTITKSFIVVR
jgi:hypothetical protein